MLDLIAFVIAAVIFPNLMVYSLIVVVVVSLLKRKLSVYDWPVAVVLTASVLSLYFISPLTRYVQALLITYYSMLMLNTLELRLNLFH